MSALVSELKHLISRLARKEVKLALKKGKGLRRENQSLRQRVKNLESGMKRVVRSIAKSGIGVSLPRPGAEGDLQRLRLTRRGIKTLRAKTRLSQAKFAKLISTSVLSVSNWELGKTSPRKSSDAFRKMIEIREKKMGAREARRALEALAGK
ncbi:MAG TPA: hypothetical protein VL860_12100 [Planctomycetota bacterium]|nr:hypothetical protein [Planctomycetota bacterium]